MTDNLTRAQDMIAELKDNLSKDSKAHEKELAVWAENYAALESKLAEVEAEKLAIAQRFDEFHPDPALMSRIIMTSIERDCQNQDLTAKLQAAETALTAARAALENRERSNAALRVDRDDWRNKYNEYRGKVND